MPFAATWVDLEIVTLSEVIQTEKEKCRMTSCMWSLKRNDTNKLTCKTERNTQTWRTNLWLLGRRLGGRTVREFGVDMHTLFI